MTAKLLIHPRGLYFTPKLKKQLRDGGYILVPEDQAGSIRVVEPLPDLSLDGAEPTWLMQNLLELVLSDSFDSLPKKLGERLIKRIQAKVSLAAKPDCAESERKVSWPAPALKRGEQK